VVKNENFIKYAPHHLIMELTEILKREFNPKHDFDYIQFDCFDPIKSNRKDWSNFAKNIIYFFSVLTVKTPVRGCLTGSIIGGLASAVSGADISTGAGYGASVGFFLDFHQFLYRGVYQILDKGVYGNEKSSDL
jgi:hypothetical protein